MLEDEINIYKATEEDAEILLKIRRDAFAGYAAKVPNCKSVDALNETVDEIVHQTNDSDIYIITHHDIPVGSIRISVKIDGSAKISRYGVASDANSKGFGKMLLEFALDKLVCAKIHTAYLYTALDYTELIGFYENFGFKVCSYSEGRGYKRARLEKKLSGN